MPKSSVEHPDFFSIVALVAFAGPVVFCWVALFIIIGVVWPLSYIDSRPFDSRPHWLVPTLAIVPAVVAVCTTVWLAFVKVRERKKKGMRLTRGEIARRGVAQWLALALWLLMLILFSYIGFLGNQFEGIGT